MFLLKKILFVAALMVASSPALVSAQGFFFSFEENSLVTSQSVADTTATESIFIFHDASLDPTQIDLNFTSSDSSVIAFTGGVVYNAGAFFSGMAPFADGGKFTSLDLDNLTANGGRVFATSFLPLGPPLEIQLQDFRAGVDGFLLARVDFDVVDKVLRTSTLRWDLWGSLTTGQVNLHQPWDRPL